MEINSTNKVTDKLLECPVPHGQRKGWLKAIKRLGWMGFVFFLIKGLLWIIIPFLVAKGLLK